MFRGKTLKNKFEICRIWILILFAFTIAWLTAVGIAFIGSIANSPLIFPRLGLKLATGSTATVYMSVPALANILTCINTHEGWTQTWLHPVSADRPTILIDKNGVCEQDGSHPSLSYVKQRKIQAREMQTLICGERLKIRLLLIAGIDAVLSITGFPETYSYIPEFPKNELAALNMIERGVNLPNLKDLPPDIAVSLSETKELVGLMAFNSINSRFQAVEISWMFHRAHRRDKSCVNEVAHALMNKGFSNHGMCCTIATCDSLNIPGVRIMDKLGVRCEMDLFDSLFLGDGEWHNEYLYAITEKGWGKEIKQEDIYCTP